MTSRPRSLFEPSPAHPYIPPSLTSPSLHSAPLRIPVRKAKCDSGSGVDLDFDETEILEDSSSSIYSTPSKSHESPIPPGDFRCHTLRRQVAFSKLSDLVSKFNSCGTGDSTDIVDSRSSHSLRRKRGGRGPSIHRPSLSQLPIQRVYIFSIFMAQGEHHGNIIRRFSTGPEVKFCVKAFDASI